MSQELALLIESSADLKRPGPIRAGPRFERPLTVALQDAAGPEGELDEAVAIGLFEIRGKDRDAITWGRAARLVP